MEGYRGMLLYLTLLSGFYWAEVTTRVTPNESIIYCLTPSARFPCDGNWTGCNVGFCDGDVWCEDGFDENTTQCECHPRLKDCYKKPHCFEDRKVPPCLAKKSQPKTTTESTTSTSKTQPGHEGSMWKGVAISATTSWGLLLIVLIVRAVIRRNSGGASNVV